MKRTIVPVILALTLTGACGTTADLNTAVPDKTTAKAQPSKAASPDTYKSGTYEVPKELKPGKYKTAGPNKDDVIPQCVWQRLKGLSGELDDIITNGVVEGPATITVKASDKGVEFNGSCKWKKVK